MLKNILNKPSGTTIAILRILIGITFFRAGGGKIFGWTSYGGWAVTRSYFEQLGIPFPDFSIMFVGTLELVCGFLLILGLFTRFMAIPLSLIMFVAVLTVHREVGYGYPILIYASTLVLIEYGGGKLSLDNYLKR